MATWDNDGATTDDWIVLSNAGAQVDDPVYSTLSARAKLLILGAQQGKLIIGDSADAANATTALATVTGLTTGLLANQTYAFQLDFDYVTSGTSVGLQMSTAFTGTTTAVRFGLIMGTSATAFSNTTAAAHGTKVGPTTTGPGSNARAGTLKGMIVTGASGGVFGIQFAAGAAGSATIRARPALWIARA